MDSLRFRGWLRTRPHLNPLARLEEGIFVSLFRQVYFPVSIPTISGAKSRAICWTSGMVRGANGLGSTTMRTPGIPSAAARARAALVKVLVMTLTDGTPLDSVITVSWRPHAVQEPQSAMAWITTSQSSARDWMVSSAQGAL